MAAIDIRSASSAPAHVAGSAVFKIVAAFNAWNDARATRKALSQLSDRELEDIGICRGDIDSVANHHH